MLRIYGIIFPPTRPLPATACKVTLQGLTASPSGCDPPCGPPVAAAAAAPPKAELSPERSSGEARCSATSVAAGEAGGDQIRALCRRHKATSSGSLPGAAGFYTTVSLISGMLMHLGPPLPLESSLEGISWTLMPLSSRTLFVT